MCIQEEASSSYEISLTVLLPRASLPPPPRGGAEDVWLPRGGGARSPTSRFPHFLPSYLPPTPPPDTHSTSLEPGNHKSVRLLHCIRGVTVSTSTIRQNMKCQSRPRSKVPPIKGHSRFMILSDGLTDHGHESMSRSSLCIFKKRFLKAFPLPCLNHAAI